MPLRFTLLFADGPRALPFVDGDAQILATSYRGAPRRANLRQVGDAELQLTGPEHGRTRLVAGELIFVGPALGVVLADAPLAPHKSWPDALEKLATTDPAALLQVPALAEPELLRAALVASQFIDGPSATRHAALFAALIDAGVAAKDAKTRKAALAAIRPREIHVRDARTRHAADESAELAALKQTLVSPAVRAALADADADVAAKQHKQAAAAAAHVAATTPEHDGARAWPTVAWDLVVVDADRGHGWLRGESSLPAAQHPRACADGTPMTHLCTLLVPREYRTRAADLVALALFQARDGGRGERPRPVHPHEIRMEDHIGGDFVVIWLTAAELARGPAGKDHRCVELRARFHDPNVGKPTNARGYKPLTDDARAAFARVHFGGTTESRETKVGPRYLHIDERDVGGNFAGDDAHLDLERARIVWGED